jgi:hypothetical protein
VLKASRPLPPLRSHPAGSGLELPLTPLPAACLLARIYLLSMGAYAVQLGVAGHWLMAPAILLLTVSTRFAMRRMWPQDAGAPRRLLLAADGRAHVATVGGSIEQVELGGESLWLGSALLLVVRSPGRTHRLLLGRGNLDPCALATLRRRLRGAATATLDPAVDSPPLSGQGGSVVEQFMCAVPARHP